MPLYWLCYLHNNQISVVIEPGASILHARLRSAIDGLDEGEFTEGHELDRKWKVPKEMVGRRLSQAEGKEVVGEVGMRAVLTGQGSTAIKSDPCFSADRARRFDTLRGAPGRPFAWAIRTASIPHHRAPSAFRTLRTMSAERVGLALPAAGRFQ
jgi:hypothetical protein